MGALRVVMPTRCNRRECSKLCRTLFHAPGCGLRGFETRSAIVKRDRGSKGDPVSKPGPGAGEESPVIGSSNSGRGFRGSATSRRWPTLPVGGPGRTGPRPAPLAASPPEASRGALPATPRESPRCPRLCRRVVPGWELEAEIVALPRDPWPPTSPPYGISSLHSPPRGIDSWTTEDGGEGEGAMSRSVIHMM